MTVFAVSGTMAFNRFNRTVLASTFIHGLPQGHSIIGVNPHLITGPRQGHIPSFSVRSYLLAVGIVNSSLYCAPLAGMDR